MAANDTDSDYDYMLFWANNKQTIPTWFTVVSYVFLWQPSSAFMERVFSIVRCCSSERQEQAYGDRICGLVMLMYHRARDRDGLELKAGRKHRQRIVEVEVQHIYKILMAVNQHFCLCRG